MEAGTTYYVQAGDDFPYGWVNWVGFHLEIVVPPPNDDFANATVVGALPFFDAPDLGAATMEDGEPAACGTDSGPSAWYAFTPAKSGSYGANGVTGVKVYTGSSVDELTNVACSDWSGLFFHAEAGTTYFLQVLQGTLTLDVLPPPGAAWNLWPNEPSTFDTVSFNYAGWDPTITTYAWDFGDGTQVSGSSTMAEHRFPADGDYSVTLTVTTRDQRTNSETHVVEIRTHDIAIMSLETPARGRVGKTALIKVGVGNTRYAENVSVELYRIVPGGYELVGIGFQSVKVMRPRRTVPFSFNYTFTNDDLALGKVTFQAVATIKGHRDAIPADNTASSTPPTLVRR